jgi:hypothetical protein
MAMGGRTDLRLVESVPASARALRKTGGHSRGILVLGVRSDLLALSASRFGGGLKVSCARNALTCRRLAPSTWIRRILCPELCGKADLTRISTMF